MAKGKKPEKPIIEPKLDEQPSRISSSDWDIRREELGEELERRGAYKKPTPDQDKPRADGGMTYAVKISSEFLGGVIVGAVIGIGVDQLVGTSPWGLIIFLFLGFAAGVMNVLRSVGRVAPSKVGKQSAQHKDDNDAASQ